MAQEELILKTLLDIKQDIGVLGQKIDGQASDNSKRDSRLDSQSDRIRKIETYHTEQKIRTGIIATVSAGAVSLIGWVAKIMIEHSPKV